MRTPTPVTSSARVTTRHTSTYGGNRAFAFAELAAKATIRPLWQRIRLGEGGLIGMTTWAAAWHSRDWQYTSTVLVSSVLLLAALYLYNDVADRIVDAHNPTKVKRHRELLLRRPRTFFCISIGLHLALCVAVWLLLGPWPAVGASSLLVLNPLYSALLKRIPVLDVLAVGVMGAAVVSLATASPRLLLLAGAMTAISHAFQTRVDVRADAAAGIRSSAVAPSALRNAIWVGLAGLLACALSLALDLLWSVSAVLPYALLTASREPNRAWGWTRLYFASVWVVATLR